MDKTYCCVPQCSSSGDDIPRTSFHRFPSVNEKSGVRLRQWIAKLRMGKKVSTRMVVCGKHFQTSDFIPRGADKVIRRRLKKTAVPSCNLPVSSKNINGCKNNEKSREIKRVKCNKKKKRMPLILTTRTQNCTPDKYSDKSVVELKEITDHKITLSSTEEIKKEPLDVKSGNIYLSLTNNISSLDGDTVKEGPENISACNENYSVHISMEKAAVSESTLDSIEDVKVNFSEDIHIFDHSAFDVSPLDSEEMLRQKLENVIAVNKMLQKKIKLYQKKYKMCEKEVNILKGVIENLKLINSVTGDS